MGALAARNRASLSGPSSMVARSAGPLGHPASQEFIDNHLGTLSHLSSHPSNGSVLSTTHSRPNTANSDKVPNADLNGVVPSATGIRPRIEDAGKRFIASGLSKPGSGITQQPISELDETPNMASYSLATLTIEEENLTPTTTTH